MNCSVHAMKDLSIAIRSAVRQISLESMGRKEFNDLGGRSKRESFGLDFAHIIASMDTAENLFVPGMCITMVHGHGHRAIPEVSLDGVLLPAR